MEDATQERRAAAAGDVLHRSPTLNHALASLVEADPERAALVLVDRAQREQVLTLRELWDRSRAAQATLVARGLEPGEVVVLILPTSVELVSCYFGVLLAGGVPALLSTPSHRIADPSVFTGRVAHVVSTSDPRFICCQAEVVELFADRRALGRAEFLLPGEIGPVDPAPDPVDCEPDTIATVQFSSGTTGAPKGVLVSHRAVLNNLRALQEAHAICPSDVGVNWIPLYHDMGLFGAFLLPLFVGCRTVLIPTLDFLRDPVLWLHTIHRHGGTFSWSPNLGYAICANRLGDRELEGIDLSTWRLALNGSEPVLAHTVEAFARRMRPYGFAPESMTPTWGLAETVAAGTACPHGEPPRCEVLDREALSRDEAVLTAGEGVSCVSVGRALPRAKVEIRDEAGQVLPDRSVGDVWLHSDSLFSAYLSDPERTAGALADGWVLTGDRGYLDDGHLFFVGRAKDLIIIGGEKYVPEDIESIVNRVPGVREGCAVVFGLLSEERGTVDLAAVVETREQGEEAQARLAAAIRSAVTRATGLGLRHLLLTPPGGVEKTTGGKIARGATRERHAEALRAS